MSFAKYLYTWKGVVIYVTKGVGGADYVAGNGEWRNIESHFIGCALLRYCMHKTLSKRWAADTI